MSWESSALYYAILNEAVRDRLGGYHSARVLVSSVDFAEVEAMQAAGEWDAAGRLLAAEAAALEAAGAECVVLCTNNTVLVLKEIYKTCDFYFILHTSYIHIMFTSCINDIYIIYLFIIT